MARQIVLHYSDFGNLLHHRTIVISLLAFCRFLRISKLITIQIRDSKISPSHLEVTIPKSKTDQHREGHIVHIIRTGNQYCPAKWLKSYIQKTQLGTNDDNFLISRLFKTENGHTAHHGKANFKDTTIGNLFRSEIALIYQQIEPSKYSLHSWRSGGASEFPTGLLGNTADGNPDTPGTGT